MLLVGSGSLSERLFLERFGFGVASQDYYIW